MENAGEQPVFYAIPGLGADERVFQFLRLPGQLQVLRWLPPQTSTEPLAHYAARLATAIPPNQSCWLIGVSFGGLLALEVGRLRPLARVVLISSVARRAELPPIVRLARATGVHHLLMPQLLKHLSRPTQWLFGAANGREYRLLKQIIQDTDARFARWAIHQLVHWRGTDGIAPIRIHGAHDRLLPAGSAPINYLIANAGHFMIVSHAAEISRILNTLAASPSSPIG